MHRNNRVVFVFVDGLGLGPDDPAVNLRLTARIPALRALAGGAPLTNKLGRVITSSAVMIPTDTTLGVPGLPQSATGQTALFTGVNASRILGRHLHAFPTPTLAALLKEKSVLKQVVDRGLSATSANMYSPNYFDLVRQRKRRHSASTLAILAAGLPLRGVPEMLAGRAVYQDITNALLVKQGVDVPEVMPETAGARLARLSRDYHFTLFEYFQTDAAGHSQDRERATKVIEVLDRFLGALIDGLDFRTTLLVITSDHGNIEDLSVKTHTMNPVPTFLVGQGREAAARRIHDLTDITPAIMAIWED